MLCILYNKGDRQSGVSYQILNFQPDAYASSASGSSNALVPVGLWTPESKIQYSNSAPIIYNTVNGGPPSDRYMPLAGLYFCVRLDFVTPSLLYFLLFLVYSKFHHHHHHHHHH
jgi:hypothetical protein